MKNRIIFITATTLLIVSIMITLFKITNKNQIKVTVLWDNEIVTFDTAKGDKIKLYEESPLPISIKIDGEWRQFGYSYINEIIQYKEED